MAAMALDLITFLEIKANCGQFKASPFLRASSITMAATGHARVYETDFMKDGYIVLQVGAGRQDNHDHELARGASTSWASYVCGEGCDELMCASTPWEAWAYCPPHP